MGKPSDEELKQALDRAAYMREQGEDPYFVAKSLMSLNYRYELWQHVVEATKLYLRSGNGATEHAHLIKAIEKAEQAEQTGDTGLVGLS